MHSHMTRDVILVVHQSHNALLARAGQVQLGWKSNGLTALTPLKGVNYFTNS